MHSAAIDACLVCLAALTQGRCQLKEQNRIHTLLPSQPEGSPRLCGDTSTSRIHDVAQNNQSEVVRILIKEGWWSPGQLRTTALQSIDHLLFNSWTLKTGHCDNHCLQHQYHRKPLHWRCGQKHHLSKCQSWSSLINTVCRAVINVTITDSFFDFILSFSSLSSTMN